MDRARLYLEKLRRLNLVIELTEDKFEKVKLRLSLPKTAQISDTKVQTSINCDLMLDGMDYLLKLEQRLIKLRQDYELLEFDVLVKINKVKNYNNRLVLNMRYIQHKPWSDIALEFCCSNRWIMNLHDKALREFEVVNFS